MNDHDLLTAIKEDFAAVQLDVPVEMILADGRSRRRRRQRAKGLAIAAVTAAGLGLGVSALTSAARAPLAPAAPATAPRPSLGRHTGNPALAAWTVVRQPDGAVAVTLHDLKNIAGLQQRLNALGVPAIVYADVQSLPGCLDVQDEGSLDVAVTTGTQLSVNHVYFVIHPAAIPRGSTLQVDVLPPGSAAPSGPRRPRGTHGPSVTTGFGYASTSEIPTINLSFIYTNNNCS